MKIDFDVIRWRFLIIGFIALFFLVGFYRYTSVKIKNYFNRESWELSGNFPAGSLGAQVQDAQRRAKYDSK